MQQNITSLGKVLPAIVASAVHAGPVRGCHSTCFPLPLPLLALLLHCSPLAMPHTAAAFTAQHQADQQQQQPLDPAQAAFEAKYNCLKSRFRKMEDSYRHELDALHEEIAVLQDRMKKLDAAR